MDSCHALLRHFATVHLNVDAHQPIVRRTACLLLLPRYCQCALLKSLLRNQKNKCRLNAGACFVSLCIPSHARTTCSVTLRVACFVGLASSQTENQISAPQLLDFPAFSLLVCSTPVYHLFRRASATYAGI